MIEQYKRLSPWMYMTTHITKDKAGKRIVEGRTTCKTPLGTFEEEEWAKLVEAAADEDGLRPLLERIKEHVREYAWMKNKSDMDVLIRAAECLLIRAYEHWEGFENPLIDQTDETGQLTFRFG